MKTLKTLIKLYKNVLDENRKALTELENHKEGLERSLSKLYAALLKEQEFLADNPQLSFLYANYSKGVKDKELILRQDLEAIEQTIIIARDRLAESFANLKRYELALDKKMAEKKIEDDRKESIMMDEISTNGYIRKVME